MPFFGPGNPFTRLSGAVHVAARGIVGSIIDAGLRGANAIRSAAAKVFAWANEHRPHEQVSRNQARGVSQFEYDAAIAGRQLQQELEQGIETTVEPPASLGVANGWHTIIVGRVRFGRLKTVYEVFAHITTSGPPTQQDLIDAINAAAERFRKAYESLKKGGAEVLSIEISSTEQGA